MRASTGADGVTLWVESVKTKQQWQVTVKKVGDCGPSGIPDDVVYTLLEVRTLDPYTVQAIAVEDGILTLFLFIEILIESARAC